MPEPIRLRRGPLTERLACSHFVTPGRDSGHLLEGSARAPVWLENQGGSAPVEELERKLARPRNAHRQPTLKSGLARAMIEITDGRQWATRYVGPLGAT